MTNAIVTKIKTSGELVFPRVRENKIFFLIAELLISALFIFLLTIPNAFSTQSVNGVFSVLAEIVIIRAL